MLSPPSALMKVEFCRSIAPAQSTGRGGPESVSEGWKDEAVILLDPKRVIFSKANPSQDEFLAAFESKRALLVDAR